MHADSAVHVYLGKACQRFNAKVGVDDEVGTNGSVRFQVYGDGVLLAYPRARAATPRRPSRCPPKGYRTLELRATDGRTTVTATTTPTGPTPRSPATAVPDAPAET